MRAKAFVPLIKPPVVRRFAEMSGNSHRIMFGRMDVFKTSWTVTNKTVGIFRYGDIRDLYYAFVKPLKNITRISVKKAKKIPFIPSVHTPAVA